MTTTKKLRWLKKRWLFDSMNGSKDACDVGVEFECSVEPLDREIRGFGKLDNSAKTARIAEIDELWRIGR
jgi:hypothetical protein